MISDWKKYVVTLSALSQLACPIFCVARGAKVKTPRGDRNIEDLRVGDEVTVVDPATRELHTGLISHIRSAKREAARLITSRGSLRVTTSHPLYDPSRNEWAPAGDWVLGLRTSLLRVDGNDDVTERIAFDGLEEVFDLSIDHPAHTFVADGVVVHNKQPPRRDCTASDGGLVTEFSNCSCNSRSGSIQCDLQTNQATCECPGGNTTPLIFESSWLLTRGNSDTALLDGNTWSALRCPDRNLVLDVVAGSSVGWSNSANVLELSELGASKCGFIEKTNAFPANTRSYGSLWLRANHLTADAPSLLSLNPTSPQLVLIAQQGRDLVLKPSFDSVGQPLATEWRFNGFAPYNWLRYEWMLEFVTPSTYRVWPRVRVGGAISEADAFISTNAADGGTQSLADWYMDGHTFGFTDVDAARVLGVGHQGVAGDADGGVQWFIADVRVSDVGWISE